MEELGSHIGGVGFYAYGSNIKELGSTGTVLILEELGSHIWRSWVLRVRFSYLRSWVLILEELGSHIGGVGFSYWRSWVLRLRF